MSEPKKNSNIHANCFTCQARARTEWCALSDDELGRLDDSKTVRSYLPGEVLYHQGDPSRGIYCFESGMVGVRKIDAEGNSVLLDIVQPGDTLGYRAVLADAEHSTSAEALKPTDVCFIKTAVVRELLGVNPALGHQFLRRAAKDADEAEARFVQSVTLSVRARFAHLLLVLRDRYATASDDGSFSLELPLSRQDLAAMIGVRPETMSRTIRQMENDGVAVFHGRIVHVPQVDHLLNEFEPGGYF